MKYVERTFAWLHSNRAVVTRFERSIVNYDVLVEIAFEFISFDRLLRYKPPADGLGQMFPTRILRK